MSSLILLPLLFNPFEHKNKKTMSTLSRISSINWFGGRKTGCAEGTAGMFNPWAPQRNPLPSPHHALKLNEGNLFILM